MTPDQTTHEISQHDQEVPTRLEKLVHEENGLNIIEIILIIFVAAVILLGLFMFFNDTVYKTVTEKINDLLGIQIGN